MSLRRAGWCLSLQVLSWAASSADLNQELLAGETFVDGVPLQVVRVTGRDVAAFVEEQRKHWHEARDAVSEAPLQIPGWQVVTRLHAGVSEVMQWRGADMQAELLLSRLNLKARKKVVPRPALDLPAGCSVFRAVHGGIGTQQFLQMNLLCELPLQKLMQRISESAQAAGFVVLHADASQRVLAGRGMEIRLQWIGPAMVGARSGLQYLQTSITAASP
jgi:hypothetical protein